MSAGSRRRFLKGAAALGALGLGAPRALRGADMPFQISLAEWSLHRSIFGGTLDHLDFARTARQVYGLEAVEYVNQFFMDKGQDRAFLQEMKSRAEGEGVRSLLIMCDREGRLGDPDDSARAQAVENHVKWLDAAVFLGCHSIRVNAASEGTREEQARLAADGLRRLTELGAERELNVIVENHGGLSSDASWLTEVMRTVDHPRCGTLPDFGNFRISEQESYDIYQGVTELMSFAKAVSAKSHGFDADGNETRIDYERMMRIVLDAGYRSYVGVEYEGRELDEPAGIRATVALLRRVGEKLAADY